MSDTDWPRILFLALALILPIAALRHSELKLSRGLLIAAAWIAIFLLIGAIFTVIRG